MFFSEHEREIIAYMEILSHLSEGYFDPTVGRRLTELGYGIKHEGYSMQPFQKTAFDKAVFSSDTEVRLEDGVEIEFGGLGKGYVLEVTAQMVREYFPKTRWLLNFGGDMAASGAWNIALESPYVE